MGINRFLVDMLMMPEYFANRFFVLADQPRVANNIGKHDGVFPQHFPV
jgi:hypothetical protein